MSRDFALIEMTAPFRRKVVSFSHCSEELAMFSNPRDASRLY